MINENLQDAKLIIQNILNQPLSIPETPDDITLLKAALAFNESGAPASYLSKIMQTFVECYDPTQTLIRELEIISEELESP